MFIVIEGPDGTGKTTLAHNLTVTLNNKYHIPTIYTSEPTKSQTGKKIRDLSKHLFVNKDELLYLLIKDRKEHLENEILPNLRKGNYVVSDRYKYSTVCYQHLQGFDIEYLIEINEFLSPDFTFILQLEKNKIFSRINNRSKVRDVFETRDYIKKSIDIYSKMDRYFPHEKFIFLNADLKCEKLTEQIINMVQKNN